MPAGSPIIHQGGFYRRSHDKPEAHQLPHPSSSGASQPAECFPRQLPTSTMKPLIGILAVTALVYRAWSRKSLTPLGLLVAGLSATAHALHPWSTPFWLLAVFYYGGTKATKV